MQFCIGIPVELSTRRGRLNFEDCTKLCSASLRTVEVSTLQRWRVAPRKEPGCIISLLTFKEPFDGRNFGGQIAHAFSLLDFQPPDASERPMSPLTHTEARGGVSLVADERSYLFPKRHAS